jgi:predicted RNA methylase
VEAVARPAELAEQVRHRAAAQVTPQPVKDLGAGCLLFALGAAVMVAWLVGFVKLVKWAWYL